jgi:hypothetical protein
MRGKDFDTGKRQSASDKTEIQQGTLDSPDISGVPKAFAPHRMMRLTSP